MATSTADSPDVTILVPAYNEENTIREVVDRLLALPMNSEIIVVNDGSTDQTGTHLAQYEGKIKVITHPKPGGKGNAIRSGLKHATGKTVIIQDADLEYFPEEMPTLINPILEGKSEVVYGSRFTTGMHEGMALPNKIVNILLRWTVMLLYGRKLTDEATCYKAFDRKLIQGMELQCQRFEFCPEVTAKSIRLGKKIIEVPVRYEPRGKDAGKKIRWTDAPEAFWTLLKYRFWRPSSQPSAEPASSQD
ncbi:MAG: glycosyltransferase family 2 protein [Armatimonadetes bacterium]|nr:glycosyltransferase family 2 protein [Armatimonadota bacterium]